MNGIEKITEKIISDAHDTERAIADATAAQVGDIKDKYDSDIAFVLADARKRGKAEADAMVERAKSGAAMKSRRIMLSAKTGVIDEAYEGAEKYFLSLPADKRREFDFALLTRAVTEYTDETRRCRELYGDDATPAASEYKVILAERDFDDFGSTFISDYKKNCSDELPAEALGCISDKVTRGSHRGGIIVVFGEIETNCSLSMLLSKHREGNEAEVCRALFGTR